MAAYQSPSPTLFVNNIEGKVKKEELRHQLYSLFTPYGRIIDIIATRASPTSSSSGSSSNLGKGGGRGTAFIVFANQADATSAMRALSGEEFYGKALRIAYAKSPSNATTLLTGGTVTTAASRRAAAAKKLTTSHAQDDYERREKERIEEEERGGVGKRARGTGEDGEGSEGEGVDGEGDGNGIAPDGQPEKKKRRVNNEEEVEDEEMEMDEDDDEDAVGPAGSAAATGSATVVLISDLPTEADLSSLEALFSKIPGFQSLSLLPPGSTPTPSASALYSSLTAGKAAAETLNGESIGENKMSVVVVPAEALE